MASSAPQTRAAAMIAFAAVYALSALLVRLGVHLGASPVVDDPAYRLGLLAGLGQGLLLGLVLALPLWSWPRARYRLALSTLAASLLLLAEGAVAHYHAAVGRLPGSEALTLLSGGGVEAALSEPTRRWALVVEALVPSAALLFLVPILARRIGAWGAPTRRVVALAIPVLGVLSAMTATSTEGQVGQGARSAPLALLAGVEPPPPPPELANPEQPDILRTPSEAVQETARRFLAPSGPAPVDSRYPYCRDDPPEPPPDLRRRSVILLILESVSMRELEAESSTGPLLPELRRMAADGVLFDHFYAAGDRSSQALVSMMAGVPAATHRRVLTHAPMARLHGFPADLVRAGYRTVYLHGSDLSFEQQRTFLRTEGFQETIEPTPAELRGRIGWGIPDGPMVDRLTHWIDTHRDDGPYLATLFTLSTHDPYAVPDDAPPGPGEGPEGWQRFTRSLAYMDRELGRLYDWYLREERPRGTLLMITGDHSPRLPHPGDPEETSTGELEYRFRVPLIVIGVDPDEVPDGASDRIGGHHDIAQTLMGRLGWDRLGCMQGRDLLASGDWPDPRWVVSMAGEQLEIFYLQTGDLRWMIHLPTQRATLFDTRQDPLFQHDLLAAQHPLAPRVTAFAHAYLTLGYYLNIGDHFVPPEPPAAAPAPVTPLREPVIVSHRGNTRGPPGPDDPPENTLDALEAAAVAGFRWVEVDSQLTRDRVVVLHHDPTVSTDAGPVPIAAMTLEELRAKAPDVPTLEEALTRFQDRMGFCIELKPQVDVFLQMDLVREVLLALEGHEDNAIVDSFSREMLSTVVAQAEVPAGYDLPQRPVKEEWLRYAASARFQWVYVRADVVTPDLVPAAHSLGLRVMVYDAPDASFGRALPTDARPDGIMTDRATGLE